MGIAKGYFDIEYYYSKNDLVRAYKHNYRYEGYYTCNVDPALSYLNEQLIGSEEERYDKAFERRIGASGYYDTHKIHKKAVFAYSFDMKVGKGDLPKDFDYNVWKKKNIDFLCQEFTKENVVSAVMHMDEGTPHIHAIVIPISKGRLSARSYFPTRQHLLDLHQRYYENCTKDMGLSPENSGVFAKNIDVKKYLHTPLDHMANEKLCEPEPNETIEEYYKRANAFFIDHNFADFKKDETLRFALEERDLLRKANHRKEEKIKEEIQEKLKQELLKGTECRTLEQLRDEAKVLEDIYKGLDYLDITSPDRAEETKQRINEALEKAREIDRFYVAYRERVEADKSNSTEDIGDKNDIFDYSNEYL